MLNDRVRTSSFLAGIREVVRPGDIVVDIGTGTGVLAVGAARAGASHVYAIESTAIADVAAAVFATSGFADRITLIRGWSSEVELPERADVLISETIGNDPLNERLLELTRDARLRFLNPDARFVPGHLTILGLPVTIPAERVNRRVAAPESLQRWKTWYDIDFTPLAEAAASSTHHSFHVKSHDAAGWPVVGDPIVLAEMDLATSRTSVVPDRVVTGRATAPGLLNGLLVYFEATLGSQVLSIHPAHASPDNSWASPVWYFRKPQPLQPGDLFRLRYQFGRGSDLSQVTLLASSSP
jgi:hypothetical protein